MSNRPLERSRQISIDRVRPDTERHPLREVETLNVANFPRDHGNKMLGHELLWEERLALPVIVILATILVLKSSQKMQI